MTSKTVLMVEGSDDEHVVKGICGRNNFGKIDLIKPYQGVDSLLEAIEVRTMESGVDALGIMLDADVDPQARWNAVTDRLKRAGYTTPTTPNKDGTIIDPPSDRLRPRVGIWLMPDNATTGILEDFLRFLVERTDPLLPLAQSALEGIPAECCRFSELSKPKALIHTWLAWQEEPGKPLGQAITARYFDAGQPLAQVFSRWLFRLYFS